MAVLDIMWVGVNWDKAVRIWAGGHNWSPEEGGDVTSSQIKWLVIIPSILEHI